MCYLFVFLSGSQFTEHRLRTAVREKEIVIIINDVVEKKLLQTARAYVLKEKAVIRYRRAKCFHISRANNIFFFFAMWLGDLTSSALRLLPRINRLEADCDCKYAATQLFLLRT